MVFKTIFLDVLILIFLASCNGKGGDGSGTGVRVGSESSSWHITGSEGEGACGVASPTPSASSSSLALTASFDMFEPTNRDENDTVVIVGDFKNISYCFPGDTSEYGIKAKTSLLGDTFTQFRDSQEKIKIWQAHTSPEGPTVEPSGICILYDTEATIDPKSLLLEASHNNFTPLRMKIPGILAGVRGQVMRLSYYEKIAGGSDMKFQDSVIGGFITDLPAASSTTSSSGGVITKSFSFPIDIWVRENTHLACLYVHSKSRISNIKIGASDRWAEKPLNEQRVPFPSIEERFGADQINRSVFIYDFSSGIEFKATASGQFLKLGALDRYDPILNLNKVIELPYLTIKYADDPSMPLATQRIFLDPVSFLVLYTEYLDVLTRTFDLNMTVMVSPYFGGERIIKIGSFNLLIRLDH